MRRQTTKNALAASFLELAEKKRIDKITIANIAQNCGLSQPTFYNHFRDKYDLIVWIYVREAEKIFARLGAEESDWKTMLPKFAAYFIENRGFVINALKHTTGQDAFLGQVERVHVRILANVVRKQRGEGALPPELLGIIKVYCYGTVRLLFEWLMESKLTADAWVKVWEDSLPEILRPYLEKA